MKRSLTLMAYVFGAIGAGHLIYAKYVRREQQMRDPVGVTGSEQSAIDEKRVSLRGRRLIVAPTGTTDIQATRVHIK